MLLRISRKVSIPLEEISISSVRAQGPGGQNVNKVSTAVHLRYDIKESSVSDYCKSRLLKLKDSRISSGGIVIIKAQRYRSLEKNREDALERLADLVRKALAVQKVRRASRPTKASKKKRLDSKSKHGRLKALRNKNHLD